MSKRILPLIVLVATASTAISTNQVRAADLDPGYAEIPALQETKVEFGSGWYIRGDLGVTRLPTVTTTGAELGQSPNITFGTGSHLGYTASLGAGYQINRWFRTDVVADFHEPVKTTFTGGSVYCPTGIYYVTNADGSTSRETTNGGCTSHFNGSLNSYDVLVNGYIDLGKWYGFTPYIGGGIGLAFGHYVAAATYTQFDGTPYNDTFTDSVTGETFHNNYDHSAADTYYNLAFALMAGVSYDIYDHTKLDVGYRYLNQGRVLGTTLQSQEVRAGLRYMIDN